MRFSAGVRRKLFQLGPCFGLQLPLSNVLIMFRLIYFVALINSFLLLVTKTRVFHNHLSYHRFSVCIVLASISFEIESFVATTPSIFWFLRIYKHFTAFCCWSRSDSFPTNKRLYLIRSEYFVFLFLYVAYKLKLIPITENILVLGNSGKALELP